MLGKHANNTYEHKSHKLLVTVIEDADEAEFWFNVENPAETDKLRAEAKEWLADVFNLYGWDYNDSKLVTWEFSNSPNSQNVLMGITEHYRF